MGTTASTMTMQPLLFRQRHYIDIHKGATAFYVLGLMAVYHAWDNAAAWLYLATHGVYGMLWVLKSRVYPDKQFEQPCSWRFGIVIWSSLSLYWIAPWLIVSHPMPLPAWLMGLCVASFGIGLFFHFVADMQKHMHMQLRPGHLMTSGLWAHCRNPNYFGELLIYLGFNGLAMHWAPMLALAFFVVAAWIPNMRRKDRSLARYPEFAAWKQQSTLMVPLRF